MYAIQLATVSGVGGGAEVVLVVELLLLVVDVEDVLVADVFVLEVVVANVLDVVDVVDVVLDNVVDEVVGVPPGRVR